MHAGARARKQKYISIYISLYMKTFLKTGVYIYIYTHIYLYISNIFILRFTVALPLIFPCVIMIIFCSNYLTEGAHSLKARWLLLGFLAMRV